MTKCLSVKDASDIFIDAVSEALDVVDQCKKQYIIYKALTYIRDNINPAELDLAIIEIDDMIQDFNGILALTVGYERAFDKDFQLSNIEKKFDKLDNEEIDDIKLDRKSRIKRDFLKAKFKDPYTNLVAGRPMLYFLRDALVKFMETFIVNRNKGVLVSNKNIPENVRRLKLELLNTVVSYLKEIGYTENQLGITDLFTETGEYLDTLSSDSELLNIINLKLTIGKNLTALFLQKQYNVFKLKEKGWEKALMLIDAYNAKLMLEDFDSIVTMVVGNIVLPGSLKYGDISNDSYKTKINKATNMWGNNYGDDVENISDLISDVTKLLIQTSKRYTWKNDIPLEDLYLSFQDFNYIMTKVKDFVNNKECKNIVLSEEFFRRIGNDKNKLTNTTISTIETLKKLREECGYSSDPTFEDVVAFISDNPQKYIHSIFDLLCNTNILNSISNINNNDKNLIWTLNKEIFGHFNSTENNNEDITQSRSLYDLHNNSDEDRIFEIITLLSDSIFADLFLQYFTDLQGILKVRFLQDYSVSKIKNEILYKMKQTNNFFDEEKFNNYLSKYNISIDYRNLNEADLAKTTWDVTIADPNNPGNNINITVKGKFINSIQIPIDDKIIIKCVDGKVLDFNPKFNNTNVNNYLEVWQSQTFRNFIKDTIGIDFNKNVDLAAAYELNFREVQSDGTAIIGYKSLVLDISRLCGSAVYNNAFNNIVVPNATFGRERNKTNIKNLISIQYNTQDAPRIDMETGVVELISDINKEAYLEKLAMAVASINGLLTSPQVKTGEGTALASQCLSCLRSSYPYQILIKNKKKDSATRNCNFVNNDNGFFIGLARRREFKRNDNVKVNVDMSATESFTASFLGFIGGFILSNTLDSINRNGIISIVPLVYSDKPTLDELMINLNAVSKHQNIPFINMTDELLEQELRFEFGPVYTSIINNINKENLRILKLLGEDYDYSEKYSVSSYTNILNKLNNLLCSNDVLLDLILNQDDRIALIILDGRNNNISSSNIIEKILADDNLKEIVSKTRKDKIISELHKLITNYNKTHRRKPIEICEQVHYVFNKLGLLSPNNTLLALWGKFDGKSLDVEIDDLYKVGDEYKSSIENFLKYEKDIRTAKELLNNNFEIYLKGALYNLNLPELEYLKNNYPDWITKSGKMTIAKIFVSKNKYRRGDEFDCNTYSISVNDIIKTANNTLYEIINIDYLSGEEEKLVVSEAELNEYLKDVNYYTRGPISENDGIWVEVNDAKTIDAYSANKFSIDMIKVHPMISKLNRISYLAAHQYAVCVGGSHYVYKGKGSNVLEEEASRWLASNKRNVAYTSTIHKYQNKTLNGVPKYYQIAPLEDIKSTIYSMMGDLYKHAPIDGGMYCCPWISILENNSLGGEAVGTDKKLFATYYYEKYAAGGIIKTAGFVITNQRMRRSEAYRSLCKNMTNRTWIKEYADINGNDIEEVIDITRDYKGNIINWILDDNGYYTYYSRETEDNKLKRFRLARIDAIYTNGTEERVFTGDIPKNEGWVPTNKYKIYEFPVNSYGEIDTENPNIKSLLESTNLSDIEPILRTFGADENGNFTINTNWELFNTIFGGMKSMSINNKGRLVYSENSIYQMVHAINNIGYLRIADNNDSNFGLSERYTEVKFDEVSTLDEVWQPLKYSSINYAPNIGALKSVQMNVNPKEGMFKEMDLNAMVIEMAQLGVQLDKEHHADGAEVSMPTQIIQACSNKGYTIQYSSKLYKALSTLTEIAISDCMDGIMELMPGNENKGKLLTEVANIIVSRLVRSQDDNSALEAAMEHLISKAKNGLKLSPEDVVGKIALSDSKYYGKIYNDLASHLTNNAIKMKFSGSLTVICPTEVMEQMYGNRRLDSFMDPDTGLSEKLQIDKYQNEVRLGFYPDLLIYVEDGSNDISYKLSKASNLDIHRHYWIEYFYRDGTPVLDENNNIYRESVTINTPLDYTRLKNEIAYGIKDGEITLGNEKISKKDLMISRVYENVSKGRELGTYNVRFTVEKTSESDYTRSFNIFDLDSIELLFELNNVDFNIENAINYCDSELYIDNEYLITNGVINYLKKNNVDTYKALSEYFTNNPEETLKSALIYFSENSKLYNLKLGKAFFEIYKVIAYKNMQQDFFALSKDYNGSRKVKIDGEILTVNKDSIKTLAYEIIMPKVYQTIFGLENDDSVDEILSDDKFFTKRAIDKVKKQHVSDYCFHYELKRFNGLHIYIWDSKLGIPDSDIFKDKNIEPFEESPGKWVRYNVDGEYMHDMSSERDKIMQIGNLGYEVIVTDNPEFYLEHMSYNLITFSPKTINETLLQSLVNNLKDKKGNRIKKVIKTFTNKDGSFKEYKYLVKRYNSIKNLNLLQENDKSPEIKHLIKDFIKEGKELYVSFNKSLDIIAGRIPAQSLQSFMPLRIAAFDNSNINSAYVSTFQLFLQGSDLDIDAVTLLGSEFDKDGKYVLWSCFGNLDSIENLEASQELPFPTGKYTELIVDNQKDSFFNEYDDFIRDLFEIRLEVTINPDNTTVTSTIMDGKFPLLFLKDVNPYLLKKLAKFLEIVEQKGLSIKGKLQSDNSFRETLELIEELRNSNSILKQLGFNSLDGILYALNQIKSIVDLHNLYIKEVSDEDRKKMAKNQCLWAIFQVCSSPSNLTELTTGMDVSTSIIKDEKTGAVSMSKYKEEDKFAAYGDYYTVHSSFLEGQIGKQCVGIGAVSIKVNSTILNYMNTIIKEGTPELKKRLTLKNGEPYIIDGIPYYGFINAYDKNGESSLEKIEFTTKSGRTIYLNTSLNPEEYNDLLELLAQDLIPDELPKNVAILLAAMLSVAVDKRLN